jgi:phosphomannomutase
MRVVGWHHRGFDGVSGDVAAVLRRLLEKSATGDVLVIHDARPTSARVLAGLLDGLAAKGVRVADPNQL